MHASGAFDGGVCSQGCTDKRVMAFFGALREAAQAEVLEHTARSDGVPAAGAVTAPLTNALERKRRQALQRRSEHEWLGACAALPVRAPPASPLPPTHRTLTD